MALAAPTIPGEAWIHFNRFGESEDRIWTVQLCPRVGGKPKVWLCKQVVLEGRFETKFLGQYAQQPRCYFVAQATVEVRNLRAVVRSREAR